MKKSETLVLVKRKLADCDNLIWKVRRRLPVCGEEPAAEAFAFARLAAAVEGGTRTKQIVVM